MASIGEWQKVLKYMEDVNLLTARVAELEKKVAKLEPRRGRPPKDENVSTE